MQNLLAIAHLKAVAHRAYVTELTQKGDFIKFVMYEKTPADPRKIESCIAKHHGRMKFVMESSPYFLYTRGRVTKRTAPTCLRLHGSFWRISEDAWQRNTRLNEENRCGI